jgi:hypothetical protein
MTTVTFENWVALGTMRNFREAIVANGGKIVAKTGHSVTFVVAKNVNVKKIAEFFCGVVA